MAAIFRGELGYLVEFEVKGDSLIATVKDGDQIVSTTVVRKGHPVHLSGLVERLSALAINPSLKDRDEDRLRVAWAAINGKIPGHRVQ